MIGKKLKMGPKRMSLDYSELNIFCEQIAMVLKAGISVYDGICILEDESEQEVDKELYHGIVNTMDEGTSFPDALEATQVFPLYMIDMIRIGELSGRLDTVLEKLAEHYLHEKHVRDSIKYAVSYPLAMMIMMGAVIIILVAKVLPIFNSVFTELGSELTGFSKNVMDIGMAFSNWLIPIILVFVTIGLSLFIFFKTDYGKGTIKRIKENSFLTRSLSQKIAVSRFASGLYLMLASGLDTDQSLEMVLPLIEHDGMRAKLEKTREDINEGKSFADAISENQIFATRYNRILSVAYKTGATDDAIENIAKRYEVEIDDNLSSIIAIIEPSLVAILSIIVGVILLSVMLPLMSIMTIV